MVRQALASDSRERASKGQLTRYNGRNTESVRASATIDPYLVRGKRNPLLVDLSVFPPCEDESTPEERCETTGSLRPRAIKEDQNTGRPKGDLSADALPRDEPEEQKRSA